jgi:hypothetical protein
MTKSERLELLIEFNELYAINTLSDDSIIRRIKLNRYNYNYVVDPSKEMLKAFSETTCGSVFIKPKSITFNGVLYGISEDLDISNINFNNFTDDQLLQLKLIQS